MLVTNVKSNNNIYLHINKTLALNSKSKTKKRTRITTNYFFSIKEHKIF